MPKNPTRKGFYFSFWWKDGSHYPIARISSVGGERVVHFAQWHSPV